MNSLPPELIHLILLWSVRMCPAEKNTILKQRQVCKAFDATLRPYIFKTVQLEFSHFLRNRSKPKVEYLAAVGHLVEAVYLNLMVVRDEEEIRRLSEVFGSLLPVVPEMVPLLDSLGKFCMNENTFDENDFVMLLENVIVVAPNLHQLKLNLPFQVVGQKSRTATLLLATTFFAFSKLPEEHRQLETLVLEHVSDTTINTLCNNPMDLKNAIGAFSGLKNLVLSIKRQEASAARQSVFERHLWFLIRKAQNLESMCLIGWNIQRNTETRRNPNTEGSFNDWMMRSLPYTIDGAPQLKQLRYLELKRVDIDPRALVQLVTETAQSLKEVYLNEVYIKVFGESDREITSFWIGHSDMPKPEGCCWVADSLRNIHGLNLDVLRATSLGYDDFQPWLETPYPDYDLKDPTGLNRSFDERFVDAVLAGPDATVDTMKAMEIIILKPTEPFPFDRIPHTYDSETYQREINNPTSHWKRCIDGYFYNYNEQALGELQNIIAVADHGMNLIESQIERARTSAGL